MWKLSIIHAESAKFAKTTLEQWVQHLTRSRSAADTQTWNVSSKDYWKRIENVDWPKQRAISTSDGGLWPEVSDTAHWRLDGSEGPLRKR